MRYLLLSVILLSACWVVAQESTTQTGSPTSGQTGSTTSGGETTVQGCLSGSNGNYMLTDKNGMSYQLTGDTAKLSQHVGHEMKVTGTTAAGTATGEMGSQSSHSSSQTLNVTSMKHISKTCQNPGGMSH